jgi:hypothetical protein
MTSRMLAVAVGTAAAIALPAATASAQSLPSLPTLPALPLPALPDNPILATGTSCGGGLISVSLAGSNVCVLPDAVPTGATPTCATGLVGVDVAGTGLVCVLPDAVPGTDGTNGTPGAGGTGGGGGGTGAAGTDGTSSTTTTTVTTTTTSASSASKSAPAKLLKPVLTIGKGRLRHTAAATIKSSTKRVVISTVGRKRGRLIHTNRHLNLKKTGSASAARPYTAKLRITFKTSGKVTIRVTSLGNGVRKSALARRSVR